MKKLLSCRLVSILLIAILVLPLSSCGALLYPERRGQTSGQIDPTVLILDGIGLLVFLIPGLIAFAVDFSTGCIYFPPDENDAPKSPGKKGTVTAIRVGRDALTLENIESIIERETGHSVDLTDPAVRVYRIESVEAFAFESQM